MRCIDALCEYEVALVDWGKLNSDENLIRGSRLGRILVWRQWPSSSLWVIGTLVGISMIMTGTTRLMISLAAGRANA